jgi:hypothetical protein
MRYPDFARVPLAILSAGLVVGAICQRLHDATPLYLVGALLWLGMLMYVLIALLKPQWFAQ